MIFMKLKTKEFPRYLGDIWIEYPKLKGKIECPDTYVIVKQTQTPDYDLTLQKIEFDTPVLVDGNYETRYKIIDLTPQELELRNSIELLDQQDTSAVE